VLATEINVTNRTDFEVYVVFDKKDGTIELRGMEGWMNVDCGVVVIEPGCPCRRCVVSAVREIPHAPLAHAFGRTLCRGGLGQQGSYG
jgi:hypothetical protein